MHFSCPMLWMLANMACCCSLWFGNCWKNLMKLKSINYLSWNTSLPTFMNFKSHELLAQLPNQNVHPSWAQVLESLNFYNIFKKSAATVILSYSKCKRLQTSKTPGPLAWLCTFQPWLAVLYQLISGSQFFKNYFTFQAWLAFSYQHSLHIQD